MSLPIQKAFKHQLPTYPRQYVEHWIGRSGHPPPSASVAGGPEDPEAHDFEYLDLLSKRNKVVFRVHDPQSVCPLIWTGRNATSGFKSPNSNLGLLEREVYTRLFGDKRGTGGWSDGPYLTHSMVDHILGDPKWTGSLLPSTLAERDNVSEDEKSPWISCSRSLAWCAWEIARRLVAPGTANEMEVAQGLLKAADDNPAHRVVSLAIVKHHSGMVGLKDERRRELELHAAAGERVQSALDRRHKGAWTMSMQERYSRAARRARISAEVLYYGRIFAENLDSNHEFMMGVCPIPLPERFWRPGFTRESDQARSEVSRATGAFAPSSVSATSHAMPKLEPYGWVAELCWDPRTDSFDEATKKMDDRQWQLKQRAGGSTRRPSGDRRR